MSEFPSDWHRDRYIHDLEREIAAANARRADAEARLAKAETPEAKLYVQRDIDGAKEIADNAARELARLRKPQRRPAGQAKETR